MANAIIITGDRQLNRALETLEPKLQKKAVRSALRKSTTIVHAYAKKWAPEDYGHLKGSLKKRTIAKRGGSRAQRSRLGMTVASSKKWNGGPTWHSQFMELGTKKMAAVPYLRPALFDNKHRVLRLFKMELWDGIKNIARAAPKGRK